MPRQRSPYRFATILEAGTRVFMLRGYRRARVGLVAAEAGVSAGTLYLYFENKEALFFTVLQRAFQGASFREPETLPVPRLHPGAILEYVGEWFDSEWPLPAMTTALERMRSDDPAGELEEILRELYSTVSNHRQAVRVMETCAADWPELFELHFRRLRRRVTGQLTEYLDRRASLGQLRRVPNPLAAARLIIETCTWFALDRHFAPDTDTIDDRTAELTVVNTLSRAFTPS